jgi:hypothetical protein
MNVDVYCEWLQRQRFRVFRSESSHWYEAGPRVVQAVPFHRLIRPSAEELRELTLGRGHIALRYSTPVSAPEGMISYHVVLRGPYDMEMLRSQARNGIRRGLERCTVERIPLERLATEGWELQHETLERQGRRRSMTRGQWVRACRAASDLPGFEAWAALVEGRLAATMLITRVDDICCVPTAQSRSEYRKLHVNNALFYSVSRELLAREGVRSIFYSLHSLDAPESVNGFKFRMGLMAKPVRQRVVFHPLLRPLADRVDSTMLTRWLTDHVAAKAVGMLRFYRQGRLPLSEQCWPDCLAEYRASLLGHLPVAAGEPGVRLQLEVDSSA